MGQNSGALVKVPLGMVALQVAMSQLGVQEVPQGSNSGPEVDLYLKSVGLSPGYAWCQAFVYWCYGKAATMKGIANPVAEVAGVMSCYNAARKNRRAAIILNDGKLKPTDIYPGDQFIMHFAKGTGHTGIVERAEYKGGIVALHTIEGNTNDDGSREGYEVARRQRLLSDKKIVALVRYV